MLHPSALPTLVEVCHLLKHEILIGFMLGSSKFNIQWNSVEREIKVN